MVGSVGVEPTTKRLRVSCSTTELQTRFNSSGRAVFHRIEKMQAECATHCCRSGRSGVGMLGRSWCDSSPSLPHRLGTAGLLPDPSSSPNFANCTAQPLPIANLRYPFASHPPPSPNGPIKPLPPFRSRVGVPLLSGITPQTSHDVHPSAGHPGHRQPVDRFAPRQPQDHAPPDAIPHAGRFHPCPQGLQSCVSRAAGPRLQNSPHTSRSPRRSGSSP